MIEVRLTTDHDDYWELKYMLDDAKEKAANKQFDELTEEQQALLAYTEPTLQTTIYWGKKFSGSNVIFRRWGVIFLFSVLSSPLDRIAGAWQGRILCDLLSYRFVYLTLGHFEKAYYYLTNAKEIHPFMRFVILPTVSSK